ncbi:MAG: tetratricopeptide repeat protein, partial [Cyclobacteriaceae bacterium]
MTNVFKQCIRGGFLLLALFIAGSVQAQKYNFESKAAKKLYLKLEKAYDSYDYGYILENEQNLLSTFDNKQDTLTALVYSFLGEAYLQEAGELTKSLSYYNKELDLRNGIQSKDDFDYSFLTSNIATLYDELGYYDKSEKLYLNLLETDAMRSGKKSDEYLESALSLAIHYTFSNEPAKGIALLKSIDQNVDKNSEKYPRMLMTFGQLYRDQGSLRQAMKHLERAFESFNKLGMNPSFELVSNLNAIHNVQADLGKFPEAEETLKEALAILDKMDGNTDDIASVFHHNLGEVYRRLGNYDEAIKSLQRSLDIVSELNGEDSPAAAEDLSSLGRVYMNDQRYGQAEETISSALEIVKANGGDDNIIYYNLLSTLASVYQENGRLSKSIQLRKESVAGYKDILGKESWEYAYELHKLGKAYQAMYDFKNAEENLEKGMKIRKASLGRYHPYYSISTR